MSWIDHSGRNVLAALVCVSVLGASTPVWAATYFCDFIKGVELGTSRPDDGVEILAITVRPPGGQPRFWFDDTTGDYQPYAEGRPFPVEHGKLPVPLDQAVADWMKGNHSPDDTGRLGLAFFIQTSRDRCVAAPMGELPAADTDLSTAP